MSQYNLYTYSLIKGLADCMKDDFVLTTPWVYNKDSDQAE